MAFATGLRPAELVGLNVGDVFTPDGMPRVRVRIRPEIAKGGRAADAFRTSGRKRSLNALSVVDRALQISLGIARV
jgi:integrase